MPKETCSSPADSNTCAAHDPSERARWHTRPRISARKALLLLLLCVPWVTADDKSDANAVVRNTVDAALGHLANQDLSADVKRERIIETIMPVFDFPLMAKLALGRQYWPQLTEHERQRYTELFVGQLQNSYAGKITLFAGQKVEFGEPVQVENKIHVGTVLVSKDARTKMVYKLYKSGDAWKIYDLEIGDVSVVSSYQAQYAEVLKTGTAADLLAKMADQTGADSNDKR